MRRRAFGLSGRLIASYILVTLAVVVLVEALVLSYQAPQLMNGTQLQAQVFAAAQSYAQQLTQRYPVSVPAGTVLGVAGLPEKVAQAPPRQADDTMLTVPRITGPIAGRQAVTAVVAVAAGGTVVASSAPSRYPSGQPAASELPAAAIAAGHSAGCLFCAAKPGGHGIGSTPYGSVLWAVWPAGQLGYVYVQAPYSTGFMNPIRVWDELGQQPGTGPLRLGAYALLVAVVPVGVLFGLVTSRRLVRRVRRLERATLAVADGDYTVSLPPSGRDEVGRLEANFTTMTRQLGSALAAERDRATGNARTAERDRLAREMHDAISQHLFALRMIAAGMRRADPGNQQARTIERISEDALRDMQMLLIELRPSQAGAGLSPALRELCTAYRDRLGVTVDASLDDVFVPAAVEHALLRITQEASTNAVKHGGARQLAVSLSRQDGHVELVVSDTGTGFDPAAAHNGSGLAHIRDRVAELGGTLDIDSAPGRGTVLAVRVPAP
jgi:signal transduction histidine kinase